MIFVDTNVIMYAVGREHPLREEARSFFEKSLEREVALATSTEVLQELLHAYLPVGRVRTLDSALSLTDARIPTVWSLDAEDVRLGRALLDSHPALSGRDLVHLASCQRRSVDGIKTFDRGLAAAFAH